MSVTDWNSIRNKVVEAFDGIPRPNLASINPLGCCNEHEKDFDWYRHHSWIEFKEGVPNGSFDPFEFNSLHPLAYHYFVPGILLAVLESIETIGFQSWQMDWIRQVTPLKSGLEQFAQKYLPKFTANQREAIASFLITINDWLTKTRGWPDTDIGRAINQVWLTIEAC